MSLESLSDREIQVVQKLFVGLPNKMISRELGITERTVKFHCANIYAKMAVSDRFELLLRYRDVMPLQG